jgi:thiosulfate reductase / polysulfide reductase chain A
VILGEQKPITVEEGLELEFDTPSARSSSGRTSSEAGFDPVPKYTKHPEPPEGHFRLITGRAPVPHLQPHADQPAARTT